MPRRRKYLTVSPELRNRYNVERRTNINKFSVEEQQQVEIPNAEILLRKEAFVSNIDFRSNSKQLTNFLQSTLAFRFNDSEHAILRCNIFAKSQYESKGCGLVLFSLESHFQYLVHLAQSDSLKFKGRGLKLRPSEKNNTGVAKKIFPDYEFTIKSLQLGTHVTEEFSSFVCQWESAREDVHYMKDIKQQITFVGSKDVCFRIDTVEVDSSVECRVEIAFRSLQEVTLFRDSHCDAIILSFRLQRPPQIWRKKRPEGFLSFMWSDRDEWVRCIDPTGNRSVFGRCTDYRVLLNAACHEQQFLDCLTKLTLVDNRTSLKHLESYHSPLSVATTSQVNNAFEIWAQMCDSLSFSVRFGLDALIGNCKFDPVSFVLAGDVNQLAAVVNLLLQESEEVACHVLELIVHDISVKCMFIPAETIRFYINLCASAYYKSDTVLLPNTTIKAADVDVVRRVFVTPTRICPQLDTLEQGNRVLRHFKLHKHRFIRVSLLDETFSNLGQHGSTDIFDKRMLVLVKEGFKVGGRHFVFLGYSNSQLREHGCWFYDEQPGHNEDAYSSAPVPSANHIRSWIGDLSQITTVGKFGARLGQGFSTSSATIELGSDQVNRSLADVERNLFCFSDGVGMIGASFALVVSKYLGMDHCPAAFQLRFGGCKGMVSVAPDGHSAFSNPRIMLAIRPSMEKFPCTHTVLEIVGSAKTLPFYLNRQLIPILSAMGVPDAVFMCLQAKMLRSFATAIEDNASAMSLLLQCGHVNVNDSGRSSGDCGDFPDADPTLSVSSLTAAWHMLNAGFQVSHEPYLRGIIVAVRNRMLLDLQMKARVFIKDSVCLYGVMDETDTLQAGEVFASYVDSASGRRVVVPDGTRVIVGRSPSLHPGDVRILVCRSVSAYTNMLHAEMVVFPSQGTRPHPNEMSGGDLDGDIYFVIWDADIVPGCVRMFPPMNYTSTASGAVFHEGPITAADIGSFFVNYIRNDNLGAIATSHVAFADRPEYGITSAECIALAQLHSTAVDFAKTGIPAELPLALKCKTYPDFLEKDPQKTYRSEQVLGQMYRTVKKFRCQQTPDRLIGMAPDTMLCWPDTSRYDDAAQIFCEEHNNALWQIMKQFGVYSEPELLSGFVCKYASRVSREKGSYDVQGRLNRAVKELRRHFQQKFLSEFEQQPVDQDHVVEGSAAVDDNNQVNLDDREWQQIAKASAWYKACYRCSAESAAAAENESQQIGSYDPLLSFGWIAFDCLCRLKLVSAKTCSVPPTVAL